MKVIIDRFEGEFAVVELEDRSFANMPRLLVPAGAGEGAVLTIDINYEETEKLNAGISKLLKDLIK
ncbi:MAG: DUF3006 domain-containing protein [Oscillospiraceae bacterium]